MQSEIIRLKQVDHIMSEKAILQAINHPMIITLYGTSQDDLHLYMYMEFVSGGELFSHLRRAGRFTNDTGKFFAASIILAMQHLHGKPPPAPREKEPRAPPRARDAKSRLLAPALDIVYRDLKPENLLLDEFGYLKITDFGFAKKVEDRTWTLCGTPEYLAPEIIQSKGHGKAVDWWALGILIYEMLAGYPPFYDENPFGIYQKILAGKVEFPRHFDVHAKDLIKKLLTADRSKRLGNLKAGAEDVKKHKWFRNFAFKDLIDAELAAPVNPDVKGEGDTHNFDQYPDSQDDGTAPQLDAAAAKKYFDSF